MPTFTLSTLALLLLSIFASHTLAQFPPWAALNVTTVRSPFDSNITISYKVPNGVCNTAFESQQQYTGWVTIPGNYTSNIFFWFVAARQPTSSLTVWLNGGPGSSSMFGFFAENGPCEVVEQGANRLGTVAREWGWDRASNMLFIDQPNQVGFSYDTPTNGSLKYDSDDPLMPARPLPSGIPPSLFMNGTFSSNNITNTANTTETAALAIWHVLQGFLGTFPQFNPISNMSTKSTMLTGNSSLGVSLFAESYGGRFGPVFADVWDKQNAKRGNDTLSRPLDVKLVALGIVNGCVDDLIQGPSFTSILVNNTYGLQLASPVEISYSNASFYGVGGCRELILKCRGLAAAQDPKNLGNVDAVNAACRDATMTCDTQLHGLYAQKGLSMYDMGHALPDSYPDRYYLEYLNSRAVQEAIGSVVNYTDTNWAVNEAFLATGDWERGPIVPRLASLLARGVRVGLMYGDRDYVCNWMGGEAVSLALAATAGPSYAAGFPAAGYAPIIVNNTYIGGVVRQFGNLSFSRIYQAGHYVPAYQPETAFQVFARIILGNSVSTGEPISLSSYGTKGSANGAGSVLKMPPSPSPTCFIRALNSTCPDDAISSILKGQGAIINGVWYPASSDWPGMTMTASPVSQTTSSTTTTATLTGLFTATATPSSLASREELAGFNSPLAVFVMVAIITTFT